MDKEKSTYETVLAFATLIISLSAFKDELKKIQIDFLTWQLNVSDYFLYSVVALLICFYLYVIERLATERIQHPRFWAFFRKCLLFFFGTILASPVILLLVWLATRGINLLPENTAVSFEQVNLISLIVGVSGSFKLITLLVETIERHISQRNSIKNVNALMSQQREAIRFIGKGAYFASARTSIAAINSALITIFRFNEFPIDVAFATNIKVAEHKQVLSKEKAKIIVDCHAQVIANNVDYFNVSDANALIGIVSDLIKIIDDF